MISIKVSYLINPCIEFLVESFDGNSLIDHGSENEEDEPPLRAIPRLNDDTMVPKEDPTTQNHLLN